MGGSTVRRKTQLALLDVGPLASLEQERARLHSAFDRVIHRQRYPWSGRTQMAYEYAWKGWVDWIARQRVVEPACAKWVPSPIDPDVLCAYLEWLSDERAPATVRQAFAALCSIHALSGHKEPLRVHPRVHAWWSSWSREHRSAPQRQAPALTTQDVRRILEVSAQPRRGQSPHGHIERHARDRALFLIGLCAGLRVSELAALDTAHLSLSSRGLEVRVDQSKTDQRGVGQSRMLRPEQSEWLCPVLAWERWRLLRVEDGPAWVEILRTGDFGGRLSKRSLQSILVGLGRAAGVPLSAHSLRATLVTLARERGKDVDDIAAHCGMRSLATVSRYTRRVDAWKRNVTGDLLSE